MSSLKETIKGSEVDELHKVIENGRQKFLCFTKLTSVWSMNVTDGIDIWRLEIEDGELDSYRELAEINTMEAYLNKIRKGFHEGELSVAMIGNKITLTIGKGTAALNFDLYETKAAEKKIELQDILIRLAETATKLDQELTTANKTISNLKAQKGGNEAVNVFMDLGPKKGPNPAKAKPKKTGMSVVNPTSKKRKAATGVVFD